MAIVGVHGIWNGKYLRSAGSPEGAAKALSDDWTRWLQPGVTGTPDVRVAYYAHLLRTGTPQGADDIAALSTSAQDMLVRWVDLLQPQTAQGPPTVRARQAADWFTRTFDATARLLATVFVREVSAYLDDTTCRLNARNAVASTIAELVDTVPYGERIVVAHSLGSVIAYEALWAYPELRIDRLITLGSPLSMPGVVFERLRPEPLDGRGGRPPGVASWINLADIGDIVAVPRGGLGRRFEGVAADLEITIANWGFHKVRDYLAAAELATCLDIAGRA